MQHDQVMTKTQNFVKMIGQIGFDPEVRELQSGRRVARISVCTHDLKIDSDETKSIETQWHTIVCWGKVAQSASDFLKKGMFIDLEGRLVHRRYESQNGDTRYITEVVMTSFEVVKKSKVKT